MTGGQPSKSTTADRLGWSSTLLGMTPRSKNSGTDKPADDQPADDQPNQPAKTEDVEVAGTGPDGEWRAETHGESPAERPKSEY